jgi:hypothetical protein
MSTLDLVSSLSGISGNIQLSQETGFGNICIELRLAKTTFDDIALQIEWQKIRAEDILLVFQVQSPGYYNFTDASIHFEIRTGVSYEDAPIIFSIVRAVQSFLSYIMEKLYITCSEIIIPAIGGGDLELQNWNVKPNTTWYVQVTGTLVILYDTQAEMLEASNAVAYGVADSSRNVVLYPVDEYDTLELYYEDLPYHLSLSTILGDEYDEGITRYFKVKPLTDISEIRHPIYNNSNIVLMRGEAELNLHTYCRLNKELVLGVHLPTAEAGDIISYQSARRNKTEKSQILSQTISGDTDSIITKISVATYTELVRR